MSSAALVNREPVANDLGSVPPSRTDRWDLLPGLPLLLRFVGLAILALGSLTITLASLVYFKSHELPPFLLEKLPLPKQELWLAAVRVHVVAAALALPGCLLLSSKRILRRARWVHRWLGRVVGAIVLLGLAPSGFYLALFAKGGLPSTIGFMLSGAIVVGATILGVRTARAGRHGAHRRYMLHVLAQLSVAVSSRAMLLALAAVEANETAAYIASLWLPVLASAGVVEWLCWPTRSGQAIGRAVEFEGAVQRVGQLELSETLAAPMHGRLFSLGVALTSAAALFGMLSLQPQTPDREMYEHIPSKRLVRFQYTHARAAKPRRILLWRFTPKTELTDVLSESVLPMIVPEISFSRGSPLYLNDAVPIPNALGQEAEPGVPIPPASSIHLHQRSVAEKPPGPIRSFGGGGRVDLGSLQVVGSMDRTVIRRVILRHINEIKFCYERAQMHDPNLHGHLLVNFSIDSQGGVPASHIQASSLHHSAVEQCIAQSFRRWQFPKPQSARVVVTFPFFLHSLPG